MCEKPNCTATASKTYTGEQGNKLKLCEKHYYDLVAGKSVSKSSINTTAGPIFRFQDPPSITERSLEQNTVIDYATKPTIGPSDVQIRE